MKPSDEELDRRFNYHKLGDGDRERCKVVSERLLDVAKTIRNLVPDGRGLSLSLTALEEARMWANHGIATSCASHAMEQVAQAVVDGGGVSVALEDM